MVYCTKCGTKNPDDATVCTQCGASLEIGGEARHYRRMETECFGIPHGRAVVGIAIGAVILIWGLVMILQQANIISPSVEVWPFAVMIFGVLVVIGALYGLSRR